MKFKTRAIHAGQAADKATGATIVPIYQTTTFTQSGVGEHLGYDYARTNNPTRKALETQIASLEGGRFGLAFASGMAASSAIVQTLSAGDHVVVTDESYGGTFRLFDKIVARFGLDVSYARMDELDALRTALRPATKLIWIETPTNPMLNLVDIAAVAAVKPAAAMLVVDSTFATPYFQQPLALGADVVLHSTTKYIGGHSDALGGAIVTDDESLYERIKFLQNGMGGVPGPFDVFLIMRGLKTLAIRMREHEHNALRVAAFLEARSDVVRVWYPGLASHPQHELARRQMSGFGGMVTFELRGPEARALQFVRHTKLFSLAESLGGVESLISQPARQTQASYPPEKRARLGINGSVLRLSVGIEDADDLIEDLTYALEVTADRISART